MGLVFRKNQRMANIISLNCLVVSHASPESISDHSIITLKISTDETVDQLRPMIKEFKATIQALHYEEIFSHELISRHFNKQLPNNKMHILVYV